MTRGEITDHLELRLSALEEEFKSLLVWALERCVDREGEVLKSDQGDFWSRIAWPEARQLQELDEEISQIRSQLGMPDLKLAARFRDLCEMRGPNAPGSEKLARVLLDEIRSGQLR